AEETELYSPPEVLLLPQSLPGTGGVGDDPDASGEAGAAAGGGATGGGASGGGVDCTRNSSSSNCVHISSRMHYGYDMWSVGVLMLELLFGSPHVWSLPPRTQ
ncbi:unnamed protein product, partial [Closterium sp. NIES-54]